MIDNAIINEIDEEAQRIQEGRPRIDRRARRPDLASAAAEYQAGQHTLAQAVQSLITQISDQRLSLARNYSEDQLWREQAYYTACADVFYAMAKNKRHDLYYFINRTPERLQDTAAISRAARVVAQHYESTARRPQRYSMTKTADKLYGLITALQNLDPYDP